MKPGNPLKHFAFAFLIALILYAIAYYSIEHRRVRNGPWRVTFTNDTAGAPKIVIDQTKLAITNVEVCFTAQKDSYVTQAQTLVVDRPRLVPFGVPFGQCIFMDTTFLPGTITLRLLGHEIELLPRTLVIDHRENDWSPNRVITLGPVAQTNKPSSEVISPDTKKRPPTGASVN